jgi:ApbE superfamily uncharacterized protein (UPF0280 family)
VLLPATGVTVLALCGDGGAVADAAAAVVCNLVNPGGEDVTEESDNWDNKLFEITSKHWTKGGYSMCFGILGILPTVPMTCNWP